MFPILLGVAVTTAQPPAAAPADQARAAAAAAGPLVDGTWSVLTFERGGESVPAARAATATVRNNTITFASDSRVSTGDAGGATGTGTATGTGPTSRADRSGPTVGSSMRPIHLDFGPAGTVRVTELNESDNRRGGAAAAARPGVYVLSRDFLAVSVWDDSGTALTANPNTSGTNRGTGTTGGGFGGNGSNNPAGGGTGAPGNDPDARRAVGTGSAPSGSQPSMTADQTFARTYMTVILRRSGPAPAAPKVYNGR